MMLLESVERRQPRHNLLLGGTTALVAGLVNVCAVIAFFAFASNVTGHWAILAEETVKGHWHQVSVVMVWLALFVLGAFVANTFVTALRPHRPYLGRAVPCVLEILLLAGVGFYGHHFYAETLKETEYLVGALLFAMGLHNGMVSAITNNVVRTTHLTGLSTDLGMELSLAAQSRYRHDPGLWFKLKLRFVILGGYMLGGLAGGLAYLRLGFQAFYLGIAILIFILIHDFVLLALTRQAGETPTMRHVLSSVRRVTNGGSRLEPAVVKRADGLDANGRSASSTHASSDDGTTRPEGPRTPEGHGTAPGKGHEEHGRDESGVGLPQG